MSLNALVRLPLSSSGARTTQMDDALFGHGGCGRRCVGLRQQQNQRSGRQVMVVEAKGKKAIPRQFQRQAPPPLPKIEDDGNPRFVIFIRTANVYLWYPLSLITGGTTAKIMVAAKDNFLGKYIYKDTIARNLAAVIYKDEKELQRTAFKQFRVLRSATSFRYGYKLVENNNLRAALSTSDVIEELLESTMDKTKPKLLTYSHKQWCKKEPPVDLHSQSAINFSNIAPTPDFNLLITLKKGVHTCTHHSIGKFVCYSHMSPYFAFLFAISSYYVPNTFTEVTKDPKWVAVMDEEMAAFYKNDTWDLVELPDERSVVGSKWVYIIKFNSDGTVQRYKAWLVAKGFT